MFMSPWRTHVMQKKIPWHRRQPPCLRSKEEKNITQGMSWWPKVHETSSPTAASGSRVLAGRLDVNRQGPQFTIRRG
jgi:hypothetical protein